MTQIEAVIFDWAGTTVDYGCMAPIHAMVEAFKTQGIEVTLEEIRKPMGMLKIDHIKAVLEMERVRSGFKQIHGREYVQSDLNTIYHLFEKSIFKNLEQYSHLIDGVLDVQNYLRNKNIKMGSTTGYTSDMINIVSANAARQGYQTDIIVAADQVKQGRPYPYMIYKNALALEVKDINGVIKVGDTIVDIQEAVYAGCWSVGVIKSGSMMGLTHEEIKQMEKKELEQKTKRIKYEMLAAGADYVIETIDELPWVIELIQQKIQ